LKLFLKYFRGRGNKFPQPLKELKDRGVFPAAFDISGMNYQQRNRALFECIRENCERTVCNPNESYAQDADFTP
jgi:hypothetical protein